MRVVLPKPSTLSWPACHGCATSPMLTIIIWMWPAITSVSAGAAPR